VNKRIDTGLRVGEYVVEAKLGEGSFGEVWRARHHAFDDVLVALKIPRNARALARLRDEGLFVRRVQAEGAVKIVGLDADSDPPYLALQYVDGESLRDAIRRGPIPPQIAIAIARRILGVLGAAHGIKIIHRDVKPENILIDRTGIAFLADFGLATAIEDARTITLASSLGSARGASVVGTLRYMAPEQKDPRRGVDHRADIYALGLVLFEMLAGTLPEGGEVPTDLVPALDPALDDVFRRCYARRERRYASAAEAIAALDAITERHETRRREAEEARAARAARPVVEIPAATDTVEGTKTPFGLRSPAGSPNLIAWDEARALLRVSGHELLRLVDGGSIARVAHAGALYFRRQDAVELRHRLRRVATPDGIELRVLPLLRPMGPAVRLESASQGARPAGVSAPRPAQVLRAPNPLHDRAAGALVRAAAFGVDATLVAVVAALLGSDVFAAPAILLAHVVGGPHLAAEVARDPVVLDVASIVAVGLAYFTLLTGLLGRTLGKWLLGLRVVGVSGEPLGVGRSAARALGYVVSATPFGLGFLSVALDPEHRGFHDIVADSLVIHE
jgi:uncharacterized RDD family membrane protein YckC